MPDSVAIRRRRGAPTAVSGHARRRPERQRPRRCAARRGPAGTTLVSGDAPDYPPELITKALESTADVVIGPSHDGGYCLLRTRRPAPELFTGISWSTGDVLDQTIAAARRLGRTLELLEPHADVDTVADLRAVDLARAPAIAAVLRAIEPAHALADVPSVCRTVDHESPWRRLVSDQLDTGQTYAYLETRRPSGSSPSRLTATRCSCGSTGIRSAGIRWRYGGLSRAR